MKITDLRIRELEGVMEHPDPFWEERLVRPVDIYPAYRAEGASYSTAMGGQGGPRTGPAREHRPRARSARR